MLFRIYFSGYFFIIIDFFLQMITYCPFTYMQKNKFCNVAQNLDFLDFVNF